MDGQIEIKGINDRLTVISILAKNGYIVRQNKVTRVIKEKKITSSVVEYEKPDDAYVSMGRSDDE